MAILYICLISAFRYRMPALYTALVLALANPALSQAESVTTYTDIAPILAERCLMCHAGETAAAGLKLDDYNAIIKGSSKGAVVQSGQPDASELIRRIKGSSQPRMPMTGPPWLSEAEIALFEGWISEGLEQGETAAAASVQSRRVQRPPSGEAVTYQHVAPIFARRCAKCHTDNGQMGRPPEGYRLTSYSATLSSNDRVRVVPGNPDASALVRHIRGQARPRMPFDGPPYLEDDEIRLIEDWITQGARNTDGSKATAPDGARVRLHGRLTGRNQLDGTLNLIISSRTRIDKNPRPGDYVQVRGHLDRDGNVVVDRLRRR